jgi:hypothetical protein
MEQVQAHLAIIFIANFQASNSKLPDQNESDRLLWCDMELLWEPFGINKDIQRGNLGFIYSF